MFDDMFAGETRQSDSSLVQSVWHARNDRSGWFVSTAQHFWEVVISTRDGLTTLTLRGPATTAIPLHCDANGEWFGIRFKPGVFMPHLPISQLVDNALHHPVGRGHAFWLRGRMWTVPTFDNADTFVDWLARDGLLEQDRLIEDALNNQPTNVSVRSLQRRFARATGLTPSTFRQIERAQNAMARLRRGESILDVVYDSGYYDQPHLTRSLKRWLGQTPAQIAGLCLNQTT